MKPVQKLRFSQFLIILILNKHCSSDKVEKMMLCKCIKLYSYQFVRGFHVMCCGNYIF